MLIQLEVSEDNEATSYPYWLILDPCQNMRSDINHLAAQITGPFFSRKEAQDFLDATRYNFGQKAKVYCKSGHSAAVYRAAIDLARKPRRNSIWSLLMEKLFPPLNGWERGL